jgi:tripartite-type tricarboxylate transporter receptor subunit TctC
MDRVHHLARRMLLLTRSTAMQGLKAALPSLIIAVVVGTVGTTAAQVYPSRPVSLIVPYAAGGNADTVARIIAERMRASLGQVIIVENAPGASGSIGVGRVARAAPDGYTLVEGNWSTHVANGAIYALRYNMQNDFEPIALIARSPLLIAGRKGIPANNLKELIAWLKANPDRATEGTAGAGSIMHVAGLSFQQKTGTSFQFVPYRSGGAIMAEMLAGRIDLNISLPPDLLPQVRAGNIKAYAVTSQNRLEAAADIPTVDEAGVQGLYTSAWFGLWSPKNTPKALIAKLNAAIVDTLTDPAVRLRLADIGLEIPGRDQQSPEMLKAFQKSEIDKWWPLIKQADIKPE